MLKGLRAEDSIAELCRRQGIANAMYDGWNKEFLEAGKKRLAGDTAPDKLEIIPLVEQSHLPVRTAQDKLGILRATFYRLCDADSRGGPEALADSPSRPSRVWNRLPTEVRDQIVVLALERPELSPRELAVRLTDERRYFISEATVYRSLKAQDLITGPAYIVANPDGSEHPLLSVLTRLESSDDGQHPGAHPLRQWP